MTFDNGRLRPWAATMTPKVSQVSIPSGSVLAVAANPARYYVGFSIGSGGSGGTLKPGSPITGAEGYQVGMGFQTLEFYFTRHGGLTMQDWYFKPTGGAITINVIEGLYLDTAGI